MLVQALAEYADTYLAAELDDPAFEEKSVGWAVEIYADGTFARLRRRGREVVRGKKTYVEDLPLRVPKSPINRNSTIYALPGCDSVQYLLGPSDAWSGEKEPAKREREREKHSRQHAAFALRVAEVAEGLGLPAWASAARFFSTASEVGRARAALEAERVKTGSVTLAVVSRDPAAGSAPTLVEEPKFLQWWRAVYQAEAAARIDETKAQMCLISGQVGPIAETHDKVKGLAALGGQASGVALMSFDKPAFQSYGWKRNENSPVSPNRATAYVLALNDLLEPGAHRRGAAPGRLVTTRLDLAGTAFLFWSARPTDDDLLALIKEPTEDSLRALLESVRSGRAPDPLEDGQVYLLAVSGNGGRLVVRHWSHDSAANIRQRVANWFRQLRMADAFEPGAVAQGFPLWKLLLATEREGEKLDAVPAARALELVARAIEGAPLGHALLGALLTRLRHLDAKTRLAAHRIALVRLCVNDLTTRSGSKEAPMSETLDVASKNPAYVCGRLLAVFEALQRAAQGDVAVTVVDRYYALASTNPSVAFPKLEQLAQHHLKKLRRTRGAAAYALEGRLADLHASVAQCGDGRFPRQLSLEDQGRFAIGFHHQKADDRARIAEHRASKEDGSAEQ